VELATDVAAGRPVAEPGEVLVGEAELPGSVEARKEASAAANPGWRPAIRS
jgi:hypothetical protein